MFTGGIINEGWVPTGTAVLLKAGSGSFQPTGSMSNARYNHTATLLQDGRVLITGGTSGSGTDFQVTQTAELYDPASGTFTRVGDMGMVRQGPSTALLSDGRVLIIGGGASASAELFDPVTNTFTATGSASSRDVSAATLLANKRVLVTGQRTADDSAPAPAEVYDPATGKFTPTGTMAVARYGYTATLLPDGTVLIAGGIVNVASTTPGGITAVPAVTEIYNPATGSFNPGPTMHQWRYRPTATLLRDGSVLFVGGEASCCPSAPGMFALASAEVYR